MQLIYGGHIFEYTPPAVKPYRKPRALNWRYHGHIYVQQMTRGG